MLELSIFHHTMIRSAFKIILFSTLLFSLLIFTPHTFAQTTNHPLNHIIPLAFSIASSSYEHIFQDNKFFSRLRVDGNLLKNEMGKTVILRGVNRSGAEYMCSQGRGFMDGPVDEASVQAMKSWHINAVRIPLNEHCWLGLNDVQPQYRGVKYRRFIKQYVRLLNNNGIYVILDLHWSGPTLGQTGNQPMPNKTYSTAFWKSVATTFRNNDSVLFDVFNEPYPDNNQDTAAAWKCWRDGGTCPGVSYPTVGMQSLVTTIRNTGATNVILLGGLQYANALSQWLTYEPFDPLHNLAASWHIYPTGNPCNSTSCYNATVAPVINKVPLIAGEVGESVNGDVCSVDGTNTVLNWLDQHNSGYLAWTWDTWGTDCGNWSLITNYDGTPKSPNGVNYKAHLLQFADQDTFPDVANVVSPITPPWENNKHKLKL